MSAVAPTASRISLVWDTGRGSCPNPVLVGASSSGSDTPLESNLPTSGPSRLIVLEFPVASAGARPTYRATSVLLLLAVEERAGLAGRQRAAPAQTACASATPATGPGTP